MSQTQKKEKRLHTLGFKQLSPGSPITGFNTAITLDGVELKGMTFFKLELKPGRVGKITLELVASVEDFEGIFEDVVVKEEVKAGSF